MKIKDKVMLLPEALTKLQRQYDYNTETKMYENISCCWKMLHFENILWVVEHGACTECGKSLTRKALLWDACFISK